MLVRLILSLLLAALTLPAMAALPCHDAPAPETAMSHHAMPMPAAPTPAHDDKAVMGHACIGCIPPSTLRTGAAGAPALKTAETRMIGAVTFIPGTASAPATPPPRLAA